MSKTVVVSVYPPILKVSSELTKLMFNLETEEAITKKLQKWNVTIRDGYFRVSEVLDKIDTENAPIDTYTPKKGARF